MVDLNNVVDTANEGFLAWRDRPISKRSGVLQGAGELMLQRQEELVLMQILEMAGRIRVSRRHSDTLRSWIHHRRSTEDGT